MFGYHGHLLIRLFFEHLSLTLNKSGTSGNEREVTPVFLPGERDVTARFVLKIECDVTEKSPIFLP